MRWQGIGPFRSPSDSFQDPIGFGSSEGGCLAPLVIMGLVVCAVVGLWYRFALTDAVGATQCVEIQYGKGAVSHWECDCPDGRRLRFNAFPQTACQ